MKEVASLHGLQLVSEDSLDLGAVDLPEAFSFPQAYAQSTRAYSVAPKSVLVCYLFSLVEL